LSGLFVPGAPYDVIVIGDFRSPGAASIAVAEELRAQAAAGYRSGLIQLKGPILTFPHRIHAEIRRCLDEGIADLLDPDIPSAGRLVLVHHPSLFTYLPRRAFRLEAEARLLIVHQTLFDGLHRPNYDCVAIHRHAEAVLGGDVVWAPVGPAVREQFALLDDAPPLIPFDWHGVLDPRPWRLARAGPLEARPVIGRHSRPDALKWPNDRASTLAAYPDDPGFIVRILGAGPFLRELAGGYPRNWEVWPFDAIPPTQFLSKLDFFVYFHHSQWVEAFGRSIIEGMASGAVAILPPHFKSLFGDGAVYAEPHEVRALVRALHADRRAFLRQSRRGSAFVTQHFGPAAHVKRLRSLIGRPRRAVGAASVPRRKRRILFVTSNGIGIGHLTRMLAVARRCPQPLEPVFLTFSQAIRIVREQGFLVEYLPYHRLLDCDIQHWNQCLHEEINELIGFYDPAVLTFDGNVPYQGLVDALRDNPDVWSVWCRRGMWQPGRGKEVIGRERHFDAVIEPRDLAGRFDRGLTAQSRSRTRLVDPIRLLDEEDLLSRPQAREALQIGEARPAVLIQLGAGNNYDYATLRRTAITLLRERHDAEVRVAEWPIAEQPLELPEGVRGFSEYPLSRYLRAFDLVISAVGYNSFHELLLAGVPAIFVPNEHPQQDDQLARARFVEHQDLGACVRVREVYRLSSCIDRLLAPGERQRIAGRCAKLERKNGALELAGLIEEMAYSGKVDRP
jgi:Glycosyltransferase family 28 C-terminal domain